MNKENYIEIIENLMDYIMVKCHNIETFTLCESDGEYYLYKCMLYRLLLDKIEDILYNISQKIENDKPVNFSTFLYQ